MLMFNLTHKQLLELKFWCVEQARDNYAAERAKLPMYMEAFGLPKSLRLPDGVGSSVLEIGTGPYWGLLPYLPDVDIRVAIDPLFRAYDAAGLLEDRGSIMRVDEAFEAWETNEQFDAIITTNALDHGEMGFYLLPKIWRMLRPGGRFYCHVHLRPASLLNLVHDHSLTIAQLNQHLSYTRLVPLPVELEARKGDLLRQTAVLRAMKILPKDIDGGFCETLMGIWEKHE